MKAGATKTQSTKNKPSEGNCNGEKARLRSPHTRPVEIPCLHTITYQPEKAAQKSSNIETAPISHRSIDFMGVKSELIAEAPDARKCDKPVHDTALD
jgi:hypothetical protein